MHYCQHCVTPANHPYVTVGDDGICSACKAYERRAEIDWPAREREFRDVVERAKARGEAYDCLIPVSGGKDSFWQVVTCREYGLNPLAVTWRDPGRLPIGQENLEALVNIGVDHLDFTINPEVERRFVRKSFEIYGVPGLPKHMALYNLPLRVATQYRIPLLVWGENPAIEYGVIDNGGKGFEVDQDWLNQNHGVTQGTTAEDWISDDLTRKQLAPYIAPPREEVAARQISAVYLGYYFPWDPERNYEIARSHGFRAPDKGPGYHVYDDVDSEFISIHHFLKWYKFGYTRLFDNLSIDIRAGRIARADAIEVIRERAPETPHEDIAAFCRYIGITIPEFWALAEKQRNTDIWTKRDGCWFVDNFIIPDWSGWQDQKPARATP